MKKKRTLMIHEFRIVWGYLAAGVLAAFMIWYMVSSKVQVTLGDMGGMLDYSYSDKGSLINFNVASTFSYCLIPMFCGICLLAFSQFYQAKQGNTAQFMNYLPFHRRTNYLMKIGIGVGVITIPFLIVLAELVSTHYTYYDAVMKRSVYLSNFTEIYHNESLTNLIIQVVMFYLFALALYSILVMMQTLITNMFAVVIGAGAVFTPFIVLTVWCHVLSRFGIDLYSKMETVRSVLSVFMGGSLFDSSSAGSMGYFAVEEVEFVNARAKMILLLCLIVISLVVGFIIWGKQDNSRTTGITIHKGLDIALFVSLVIVIISLGSYLTMGPATEDDMGFVYMYLRLIGIAVEVALSIGLGYFMFHKKGGKVNE